MLTKLPRSKISLASPGVRRQRARELPLRAELFGIEQLARHGQPLHPLEFAQARRLHLMKEAAARQRIEAHERRDLIARTWTPSMPAASHASINRRRGHWR